MRREAQRRTSPMWTVSGSAVRNIWVGSRHLASWSVVVAFRWAHQRSPEIASRFVELHVEPALEATRPAASLGAMSGGMDVLANELGQETSLDGRLTREVHAVEVARIDRILREHGLTWADLQNP